MAEESLTPNAVARKAFSSKMRGFDPDEVRAYLRSVADEIDRLRRELASARDEAAQPAPAPLSIGDVDRRELTARLGEEAARVLDAAHASADDIKGKAEQHVTRLLREARDEATGIRTEAEEERVALLEQADTDADAVRAALEEQREETQREAAAELERARAEGRSMVQEAREIREKILGDLGERRRQGRRQLEQIRAGSDRMLDAVVEARRLLDETVATFERSPDEARAAAERIAESVEPLANETELRAEARTLDGDPMVALATDLPAEPPVLDGPPASPEPVVEPDVADEVDAASDTAGVVDAEDGPAPTADHGEPTDEGDAVPDEPAAPVATVEPAAGEAENVAAHSGPPEPAAVEETPPADDGTDAEPAVALEVVDPPEATVVSADDARRRREERTRVVYRRSPKGADEPGDTADAPVPLADASAGDDNPQLRVVPGGDPVDRLFARMRERDDAGDAPADDGVATATAVDTDLPDARVAVVDQHASGVSRALKRAANDWLNDTLDWLRNQKSEVSPADVPSSVKRFSDAMRPPLGEVSGGAKVTDLARTVATDIDAGLRSRLGDDPVSAEELAQLARSITREWRQTRADDVAADAVAAAHDRRPADV